MLATFARLPQCAHAQTSAVESGAKVTFIATADGTPPLAFEWSKDGAKIGEGATFVIDSITAANAGSYTVKASNPMGDAVSPPYACRIGD